MSRSRRTATAALAVACLAAALLVGCSEEEQPRSAEPSSTPSPSEPTTSSEPPEEEPSESPSASASGAAVPPTEPLEWKRVPGPASLEVTTSGRWRLARASDGSSAELSGPAGARYKPPAGYSYSDVLIDGQFAVVVAEHDQASRPDVAEVVDLSNGGVSTIDGRSDPATAVGGSWELASGLLSHATLRGRDYCLATVDLLSGRGETGPCVPPRHGFTNVTTSPAGTSAMSFDDARPSCRTLNRVAGSRFVPLRGVTRCTGWDVATTETAAVWSELPDERRVEEARFFTDAGGERVALGPGTSGSLTWCGDSAWFVRDPQRASEPARLIRVRDGEATVAYESTGTGRAFLDAPRCGGTDLTVTAFSEAGDEQVTTKVG